MSEKTPNNNNEEEKLKDDKQDPIEVTVINPPKDKPEYNDDEQYDDLLIDSDEIEEFENGT